MTADVHRYMDLMPGWWPIMVWLPGNKPKTISGVVFLDRIEDIIFERFSLDTMSN